MDKSLKVVSIVAAASVVAVISAVGVSHAQFTWDHDSYGDCLDAIEADYAAAVFDLVADYYNTTNDAISVYVDTSVEHQSATLADFAANIAILKMEQTSTLMLLTSDRLAATFVADVEFCKYLHGA